MGPGRGPRSRGGRRPCQGHEARVGPARERPMTRLGEMAIPSGVNVVHDETGCGRGVEVAHQQATLLPVNLDVSGLPVTVVGGGGAALRRVAALREAWADVT